MTLRIYAPAMKVFVVVAGVAGMFAIEYLLALAGEPQALWLMRLLGIL